MRNKIKIKFLYHVKNGATPKSSVKEYWDGDIVWVTPEDLEKNDDPYIYASKRYITKEGYNNSGTTLCPKDSIVISNRAPIGSLGIAAVDLCTNQGCKALVKINKQNEKYTYYNLVAEKENINALGKGTTFKELSTEDLRNFRIQNPKKSYQEKIASFLDKETFRVDTLIAKKERQIELLQEKRQAIITHAVTKGINPNAKMKDSGVEWIEEIPEHWEVVKIRHLSLVKRGASPRPIDDPIYFDDEGEYSWVRIADVTASSKYLQTTTQRLSELGSSLSVKLIPGKLFLSIAGSVGKPMITKINCCIHDGFVYFPFFEENNEFLYYIFLSGQPFGGLGKMGTQLNLNTDTVGDIKIPFPPRKEQDNIVEFLIVEMGKNQLLIDKVQKSIDLLKEYRSSLITHAVTGQIDIEKMEKVK